MHYQYVIRHDNQRARNDNIIIVVEADDDNVVSEPPNGLSMLPVSACRS